MVVKVYISGIKNRISTMFLKLYYKICYGKKLVIGKHTHFRKSFIINIRESGSIKIGNNCFFNNYCSINCLDSVEIGNDCIFGENVKIYDHNHRFKEKKLIRKQGFKTDKIKIGNNCWIGSNVVILKGVTIGENVVIGAGCVINKSINDNQIVRKKEILEIEERK